MSKDYLEKELPLEAKSRFIFISLVIAFIINLFPLQEIIFLLRPDFVALTLLFWNINQPHHVGMSIAFTSGIIMDVCNSSILGQHALAYCFMSFLAIILHRRLVLFSVFQQAPQIFWILLLTQVIIYISGTLTGSYHSDWYFFLSSVTGALIWPVIALILGIAQKPETDPNAL